jgi:hypothetical protein
VTRASPSAMRTKAVWVVLGGLIALSVGLTAWFWPRSWSIAGREPGSHCIVSAGMTLSDVVAACGPPLASGTQPKLMQGLSTVCSAACELYQGHVVFHDCEGAVYAVAPLTDSHQGCVFEAAGR